MRPRFLADANFNADISAALRRIEPSIDFESAEDAGLRGLPDPLVLSVAADRARILVTHDVATMPVHFAEFVTQRESPGVLIVRQKLRISLAIEELLLVWAASEAKEWRNLLQYLPLVR